MSNTYTSLLERVAEHSDALMADVRSALVALGTGLEIDPTSADGYRRWSRDQAARKRQDIPPNQHHPVLWSEDCVSEKARERWEAETAKRTKALAEKRRTERTKRNSCIAKVQRALAANKVEHGFDSVADLETYAKALVGKRAYFSGAGFISAQEAAENGTNAQSDTVAIVAAIQHGFVAWQGRPRSGETFFCESITVEASDDETLDFD